MRNIRCLLSELAADFFHDSPPPSFRNSIRFSNLRLLLTPLSMKFIIMPAPVEIFKRFESARRFIHEWSSIFFFSFFFFFFFAMCALWGRSCRIYVFVRAKLKRLNFANGEYCNKCCRVLYILYVFVHLYFS